VLEVFLTVQFAISRLCILILNIHILIHVALYVGSSSFLTILLGMAKKLCEDIVSGAVKSIASSRLNMALVAHTVERVLHI
jgi:hypothetical protein